MAWRVLSFLSKKYHVRWVMSIMSDLPVLALKKQVVFCSRDWVVDDGLELMQFHLVRIEIGITTAGTTHGQTYREVEAQA
jgi:hypothetical protein